MKKRITALLLAIFTVMVLGSCGSAGKGEETEVTTAIKDEKLPDFTVYDGDGNRVTLYEKRGKPVVVNFWATWCPPCQAEMPSFDKLYGEYGDEIEFMMINLTDGQRDSEESVKTFISGNGYSFPVYYDSDRNAAYNYGVQSIPMTFFVNADGSLLTYHSGMISEEALRACLDKLKGE